MGIKAGSQVSGHLVNEAVGRVEFTGRVEDVFQSGGKTLVNVACDDGIERTAVLGNLTAAGPSDRSGD